MASVFLFVLFILSLLVLLHSAEEEVRSAHICRCKDLDMNGFPYTNMSKPDCGYFRVDCANDTHLHPTTIQLEKGGKQYEFLGTSHGDEVLHIVDLELWNHLKSRRCESLTNLSFPNSSHISFEIVTPNQTFFKCNNTTPDIPPPPLFEKLTCKDSTIYYSNSNDGVPEPLSKCSIIHLPKNLDPEYGGLPPIDAHGLFRLLGAKFELQVRVSKECKPNDEGEIYCVGAKKGIKIGITQQYLGRHIYIHSFMKMHTNFFFLFRINYS